MNMEAKGLKNNEIHCACRYKQQLQMLQQEQRDLTKEIDMFSYNHMDNIKYLENIDDRKLAIKHNKAQIELAKASHTVPPSRG